MEDKFISKIISRLGDKLSKLNEKYVDTHEEIVNRLSAYLNLENKISSSWAGKWLSNDFDLYYNNFDLTKNKGRKYNYGEIIEYADLMIGVEFSELSKRLKAYANEYEDFSLEVITDTQIIKDSPRYQKESELLNIIEDNIWFMSVKELIEQKRPSNFFMDGSNWELINKGYIDVPPHIQFSCAIVSEMSRIVGIDNFKQNTKRLLRQIEIKLDVSNSNDFIEQVSDNLVILFNRFHNVARQIKNRHNKRPTIDIDDEYDVQDLLYSLLKIFFEDIRPEEYTPSYAGSRTRMDFLLKKEKTVIEVKKTRDTLKDKEVGNELILDIARYKAHPECRKLICFVYDPENKIENPKGLEYDLVKLSNDDLEVEVYIRP